MADKIGLECKVYRTASPLTSTAYGGASWLEAKNVRDVSIDLSKGEADMSTRASTWRETRGTLKEGPVTMTVKWDVNDALCAALLASWLNNTMLGLAFLDGAVSGAGAQGPAGNYECINFPRNEQLEEGVMIEVVVKPRQYQGWFYTGS
jgi:hypothetical protein